MWKPIPSGPGYEVSDDGRVRSLKRGYPIELKLHTDKHGYLYYRRCIGERKTWRTVHGALMEAHVGPRPEGQQVRHLNGNNQDNRLSNLVYGTHSENILDQVRHGRHGNASKTHCRQGHQYDEANTYHFRNARHCRACNREAQQRRNRRAAGIAA